MTPVRASRLAVSPSSAFFDPEHTDSERPLADPEPAPPRRRRRLVATAVLIAAGLAAAAIVSPVTNASADPSANDWARLRNCESSGDYQINTGNGHYGAYQFDLGTWQSVGGSGLPSNASPAEQDARALILYRERGWQPWQCAGIVGLVDDSDAGTGRISDISVSTGGSTGSTSAPTSPAPAHQSGGSTSGVPAFPGPHYFHYGDHSSAIKQFQDHMHARGYFPVGTGDYGPNTQRMVKQLQSLNGLIPNGEIGPNTWRLAWTGKYTPPKSTPAKTAPAKSTPARTAPAKTTAVSKKAPAWTSPVYFNYGNHGTTIKRFQDQMHARGVFPVGTGDFGPNTLRVVKQLQKANGLPETGLLGPVTWKLAWTGKF